jgi:predicted dehydrogenase
MTSSIQETTGGVSGRDAIEADLSRRDFLKASAAAGAVAAVGLGGFYFGYGRALGSPVRVGVVGTGDEGSVLIGALNPAFIEVRSIADIRPYNQFRAFYGDYGVPARLGLMSIYGWKSEREARRHVQVYGPYEELLEHAKQDGIEAIVLALPLHLHAPVAVAAMKQGLHVLTEKLMAQTVYACKEMARVARQTGRCLAIGHQRHYNILYWEAVDMIKRGLLGDIHSIRAQWNRSNLPPPDKDSWKMPLPSGIKDEDASRKLDEDVKKLRQQLERSYGKDAEQCSRRLAQLQAQVEDKVLNKIDKDTGLTRAEALGYRSKELKDAAGKVVYQCPPIEELIRWRLWDRTGAGMMAELGSHQLDAASIFVSAMHQGAKEHPHPLRVVATANRPIFGPDRDIEDHVYCILDFPAPGYDRDDPQTHRRKITAHYSSINGNGYLGYGELVFGTKGTLALEKEQELKPFKGAGDDDTSETTVKVSGGGTGPTLDTQASGPARKSAAGGGQAPVSRGYAEELEHWAWCIRHPAPENQPRCHPRVAMADAIIALTANMAAEQGKPIRFQEAWFDPDKDDTPEGVAPNVNRYS